MRPLVLFLFVLATGCGTLKEVPLPDRTYTNPVLDGNFPDPFVLKVGNRYHLYATNGSRGNVPTATSTDLVHWTLGPDALPQLPAWAQYGLTWAPEVLAADGGYLLYYTVRDRATNVQTVSVAWSKQPEGPFVDTSDGPLVNQALQGGSIDASPFRDRDGRLYLYWKNDGNAIGFLTGIHVQELTPDGRRLTGEPTELLVNTALWEGTVIEAPTVKEVDGVYFLLFSASDFASDLYGVGYTTGPGPRGPFTKSRDNPVVFSAGTVAGPGHQCLVQDGAGQDWLVYHAWTAPRIGDGQRSVRIDRIAFDKTTLRFSGVTETPQPAPVPLEETP